MESKEEHKLLLVFCKETFILLFLLFWSYGNQYLAIYSEGRLSVNGVLAAVSSEGVTSAWPDTNVQFSALSVPMELHFSCSYPSQWLLLLLFQTAIF